MVRPRFSMLHLIAVIAAVAILFACVRRLVDDRGELLTLACLALIAATSLARASRGRVRSFAGGFAMFGWGYLLLWLSPAGPYLPTTLFLESLFSNINGDLREPNDFFDAMSARHQFQQQSEHFRRAGQSLVTLAVAFLGGLAFRGLIKPKEEGPGRDLPDGSLLNAGFSAADLADLFGAGPADKPGPAAGKSGDSGGGAA